jgi:hypothetical protein
MAHELGISDRKFRELLPLGVPHTQLGGILWFEPDEVHAWLDKFHRKGRPPGVKRSKGIKVAEASAK